VPSRARFGATPAPAHPLGAPTSAARHGRDLTPRTGLWRAMTETTPIKKLHDLPPLVGALNIADRLEAMEGASHRRR
jgi:hypothetical protein